GDIIIRAGDISLADGGIVAAQSILAGNSGNITVHATGSINLNNGEIRAITAGSGEGGEGNVTAGQSITPPGSCSDISTSTRPGSTVELDTFARKVGGPNATYAGLVNLARQNLGIPNPTLFDVLRMLRDVFHLIPVEVTDLTVGNAGKINLTTPQL